MNNYFVFKFNAKGINIEAINDRAAATDYFLLSGTESKITDSCFNIKGFEPKFFNSDVFVVKTEDFKDGDYFDIANFKSYEAIGFKME
ncbi:hypothetical protein QPK06_19540 [Aeromonas veronii]|uniref:hypothetical protein n=1 Tax=Aeromonas veronii TaxID=654 RepID=UPI00111832A2|nr:hypothetical protein [Aeromonas veronii]MCX0421743.1 hypothetical protein [Aeromonas veronii]TNI73625.1 hypothetical protein CF109_10530 [Aeromonas veronii]WIJ41212.1 hypothetical protein QPK06_19540 [Aeromonas veronii]